MVCDLEVLRSHAENVRMWLDHRLLDDVEGLGFPTLENLCAFIASKVPIAVTSVRVWRADGGSCLLELVELE